MTKRTWILLLLIVILASFLRFWQLGKIPISPDWDEAALGYNAYSILHTGRDEYGKLLPIVLESFGDYKPALYAYLIIPFIVLFHLTVTTVRMPSAIMGICTVIATFFLVKELTNKNSLALLSSFLLAISPWHLQFSRIGFEANVAVGLNVLGLLFFFKGLKKPWYLLFSALFFACTLYTYQSEKVFMPLMIILLGSLYWKKFITLPRKYTIVTILFGVILITPMALYTLTNKGGLARATSVSIFSEQNQFLQSKRAALDHDMQQHDVLGLIFDNRRVVLAHVIATNYFSHFSLNWLFVTGDAARHHAPGVGLLYISELPFLLIGMYWLLFGKYGIRTKIFLFSWFIIAPIPSSIALGAPHAVRALNFLPTFQIFTAIGMLFSFEKIIRIKYHVGSMQIKYVILSCLMLFFIFNFSYYLDQYFVQQNYLTAQDWQYGYAQTVADVQQLAPSYQKIIVSSKSPLDQSYIFFLFYLKYPPANYQSENIHKPVDAQAAYGKFVFRPITWENESKGKGILYVGSPQDFPDSIKATKAIYYPNGQRAMLLVDGNTH